METSSVLEAPQRNREERELIGRLAAGDEQAFGDLVDRYHSAMIHVALGFVPSRAVAEEVVQETWLAVVAGISRFESRCSLKTWLFRILVNRARTRGAQEHRCVAFSALPAAEASDEADDRFSPEDRSRPAIPAARIPEPADVALNGELGERVLAAVDQLAGRQRHVLVLRDVEGWSAAEVCDMLRISEVNQRVLLHRARNKVRTLLVPYLRSRC